MGKDDRRGWSLEWWIPAAYAAVAGLWIYTSDTLVAAIAGSMERQRAISSYKGFGFVIVTAALLHGGLRWALGRERAIARRARESEALLRAMMESSPDMIAFALDRNYSYLAFNARHKETIRAIWNREIAPGMNMLEVIGRDADRETARRHFDRALAGESFDRLEVYGDEELSRNYWQDFYGPIRTEGGEIIGLTCYVVNITEHKRELEERHRLQAQLRQVQQLESLGRLAGGVAHDMNNVLGAILAISSADTEAQAEGSPLRQDFETISRAAVRGGEMVKRLLNLARRSPVQEDELDLNGILRETAGLLERATLSKIRLDMDLSPDLAPVRGDAGSLVHAFMNLCVNAVDAMPENGVLTLRSRNVDERSIEIQVQDTGSGMSRDVLDKALDPFFTTKEQGKGTGLGLSMVYSTVKAHRGQMEIQSVPGKGTCVSIRLPACIPAPSGPSAKPAEDAPGKPSDRFLNVLLVDDDELIQSSMQALLAAKGHVATPASSGEEALAKLETGFQPDVVILDMNMPGLGGAGTLPRLRALRAEVPVLLATGRPDQAAQDLVETYPGVSLLPKPFSLKDLQKALEPVLAGRRP